MPPTSGVVPREDRGDDARGGAVVEPDERRVAAEPADPLVPLELFKSRMTRRGVVLAVLGGATRGSTFVLVALYLQQVLAMPPQQAGIAMVPTSLTGFAVSLAILPRALKTFGPLRTLVFGRHSGIVTLVSTGAGRR